MKFSVIGQEKCDLLIEVTICAGFTVFNLFSDIDIKKRFNAQN
jgi:hypothetical protein